MKKLFSLLSRLVSFITFSGVVLFCIGYYFTSKARRINELFMKKEKEDIEE